MKAKKPAAHIAAKAIRVITVPPLMALFVFTALLFTKDFYKGTWEYFLSAGFIALLPFTAYPLQLVIPPFKHQGRDGQRSLAFIMCNLGYVLAVVLGLILGAGEKAMTMLITYLLSGITLLLINKLFKFKASGHSCGLLGPLAALVYFVSPIMLIPGIILFALTLWSSVYLGRHTVSHFAVGGIIPVFWLLVTGAIIL